jgi:hypothetical protein
MAGVAQVAPFGLRMPGDLKEWVMAKAVEERRSTNSYIVVCLERLKLAEDAEKNAVQ